MYKKIISISILMLILLTLSSVEKTSANTNEKQKISEKTIITFLENNFDYCFENLKKMEEYQQSYGTLMEVKSYDFTDDGIDEILCTYGFSILSHNKAIETVVYDANSLKEIMHFYGGREPISKYKDKDNNILYFSIDDMYYGCGWGESVFSLIKFENNEWKNEIKFYEGVDRDYDSLPDPVYDRFLFKNLLEEEFNKLKQGEIFTRDSSSNIVGIVEIVNFFEELEKIPSETTELCTCKFTTAGNMKVVFKDKRPTKIIYKK